LLETKIAKKAWYSYGEIKCLGKKESVQKFYRKNWHDGF
jgi:hypothetical protein